jgi:hypothetical protein
MVGRASGATSQTGSCHSTRCCGDRPPTRVRKEKAMSETSTNPPPPNPYGQMARQHWAKWRPNELSQIPTRRSSFRDWAWKRRPR